MNSVGNLDLSVEDYLKVLLHYWWLFVLAPVLLGGMVYGFLSLETPLYEAKVRILVQQSSGSSGQSLGDVNLNVALIRTYSAIVGSDVVLERAAATLSPEELSHFQVSAQAEPGTQIMDILSRNPNPQDAATIANTVAESLIAYVRESQLTALAELLAAATLQGVSAGDTAGLFAAQVRTGGAMSIIDHASPPSTIVSPNVKRSAGLAFFLGIILALPMAFGLSMLRNKVDSLDSLEQRFSMVPLGTIGESKSLNPDARFIIEPGSNQPDVEQFRGLRSNIQFRLSTLGASVIAVSSARPGEGKSTIAANLAAIIAFGGKNVLIIDADMRRPAVSLIFNVPNDTGLSNFLAGMATDLNEIIKPTDIEGLSFIPSGPLPPNPTELLASAAFHKLLETARGQWDVIVVDTPPVLAVADASVIAPQVDGMLLVADRKKTKVSAFGAVVKRLNLSSAVILGAVLNRAEINHHEYSGYYHVAPPSGRRRLLRKLRWW